MAHVVTHVDTTASPERVIDALTDFSPRRFELWPNIDRNYYKLGPIGSFWLHEVTPGANGGSHVRMEFRRRPRNLKGLLASALLSLFGKRVVGKSLRATLGRIERA